MNSPPKRVAFSVSDYQHNGSFAPASYVYEGDESHGWTIERNGHKLLETGPGFLLTKTSVCGVCSTDLARRWLPYPLPQIIGHEVIVRRGEERFAVEINASHRARHVASSCPFCSMGFATQCPERITLGIDRLPGGFAPWVLSPVDALIPVPKNLPDPVAALTEPFAAALHALDAVPPENGDEVAVLGPRRLGALLIAALSLFRRESGRTFSITAVVRREKAGEAAVKLGADKWVVNTTVNGSAFDVVYDTSASPDGFAQALNFAKHAVHLKSTHGQNVLGLDRLSDFVVDELSLAAFRPSLFPGRWPTETWNPRSVLLHPRLALETMELARTAAAVASCKVTVMTPWEAVSAGLSWKHSSFPPESPLGRFDAVVVPTLDDVDEAIRPVPGVEFSVVRPRGFVFVARGRGQSLLDAALFDKSVVVSSSRCGDFRTALELLSRHPDMVDRLSHFVTGSYPLGRISEAFEAAARPEHTKILVRPDDE